MWYKTWGTVNGSRGEPPQKNTYENPFASKKIRKDNTNDLQLYMQQMS